MGLCVRVRAQPPFSAAMKIANPLVAASDVDTEVTWAAEVPSTPETASVNVSVVAWQPKPLAS
jgi:hypothetical protein